MPNPMSARWLIRCLLAYLGEEGDPPASLTGATPAPAGPGATSTTFTVTSTGKATVTISVEPTGPEQVQSGVELAPVEAAAVPGAQAGASSSGQGQSGQTDSTEGSDKAQVQIPKGFVALSSEEWCTHVSFSDTLTFLTTTPGQPKLDRHRQLAVSQISSGPRVQTTKADTGDWPPCSMWVTAC